MAREWYKKLGFKKNPLNVEPRFNQHLFGYDVLLDELFYRIEAGNLIFIEGEIGKTSVLLKIIEKYEGKGRVAYVDCKNVKEEPDMKKLLANGKPTIGMRVGNLPKDMIVLLDNISVLSKRNAQRIKYYFDQGNILSLVLTGTEYHKADLPLSINHRIGRRVYKLRAPSQDEAVDIVMDRLNFTDFLKEEFAYKIAAQSKDLKELFESSEIALRLMINEHIGEVNDNIVNKALGERIEKRQRKREEKNESSKDERQGEKKDDMVQ